MCGIVAVLARRGAWTDLDFEELCVQLRTGAGELQAEQLELAEAEAALGRLETLAATLKTRSAIVQLARDGERRTQLTGEIRRLDDARRAIDRSFGEDENRFGANELERANAFLVKLRDVVWALEHDAVETSGAIARLAGTATQRESLEAYLSIQLALSALDRLEVRGRDSAGVCVLVRGADPTSGASLADRSRDELLRHLDVRVDSDVVAFVYKRSAEIGELGDNVAFLREAITRDADLRSAVATPDSEVTVLAHTRWASVGLINEVNTHPLDSVETQREAQAATVFAALNGDVDNHLELKEQHGLLIAPEITTDAKVIPVLSARGAEKGQAEDTAFRNTVAAFEGSVAIAQCSTGSADRVRLALRGSGQALYVGFAQDTFLVASEPYGVVEVAGSYLRLDGETPGNPDNPSASRGQVVVLDREHAGELEGVDRCAYDGTDLPVHDEEIQPTELTTRDVDRGDFPHFLIKEISEAPESFRKTLRGKIRRVDGRLRVELSDESLPAQLRERVRSGAIRRILVIGQGTAAVAGQGVAAAISGQLALTGSSLLVEAIPATELSGFHLAQDMSDVLIVAISQSGTTTDTNRTVDLARARGAAVVAIVNRRQSDLTDKVDGVVYTSDGRDVEMSVASTKAFYSQIAAGFLLAVALSDLGTDEAAASMLRDREELLEGLIALPVAMRQTLEMSDAIGEIAAELGPPKRYWALVGNGANRTAAEEIRIKLSELCYKSIACDVTEDKKHIDLSCEPLVIVCAAGLKGSVEDDVAKEIGIFSAHKATPIVFATKGAAGFQDAAATIELPPAHPELSFILSTVAGHLFGYHAALAIDAQALPLRAIRAEVERVVRRSSEPSALEDPLVLLRPQIEESAAVFRMGLEDGRYDGHLEASTAVALEWSLRFATGELPLESYEVVRRRRGAPSSVIEDLASALTSAIEELTRPIDAIKHQAKTVTVGISRTDEAFLTVGLVRAALEAGLPREAISYSDLRSLAAIDPVVSAVTGSTRYRISGSAADPAASIEVVAQGGAATGIESRTTYDPRLKGTKHLVAVEGRLLVARGRSDGRTFVLVPERGEGRIRGLVLLHVDFKERASRAELRGVLSEYENRYDVLRDFVMETEPEFREDVLERIPAADLLIDPPHMLAEHWAASTKVQGEST